MDQYAYRCPPSSPPNPNRSYYPTNYKTYTILVTTLLFHTKIHVPKQQTNVDKRCFVHELQACPFTRPRPAGYCRKNTMKCLRC